MRAACCWLWLRSLAQTPHTDTSEEAQEADAERGWDSGGSSPIVFLPVLDETGLGCSINAASCDEPSQTH